MPSLRHALRALLLACVLAAGFALPAQAASISLGDDGTLTIQGGTERNTISLSFGAGGVTAVDDAAGTSLADVAPQRIDVFAGDGNDTIDIADDVVTPVTIHDGP